MKQAFGAGFAFLGFQVGVKTIYSSFALSFMVWLFEHVYPMSAPLSDDKLIQLLIGLLIAALGLVIVFRFLGRRYRSSLVGKER